MHWSGLPKPPASWALTRLSSPSASPTKSRTTSFASTAHAESSASSIGSWIAKQKAPDCFTTYSNYPSTEFLSPSLVDFYCANIDLHDPAALACYLDRLQHVAGEKPLIIGEHGVDSIREGSDAAARMLQEQIDCLFAKGVAGSFVFSYTDEWFAGGQQTRDWAFWRDHGRSIGETATAARRRVWDTIPHLLPNPTPKVSVVVCPYKGACGLDRYALAESQPTRQFAQDTDAQSLGLRKNVRDDLAVHIR